VLSSAWGSWADYVTDARIFRTQAVRAVRLLMDGNTRKMRSAFATWHEAAASTRLLKTAAIRIITRSAHRPHHYVRTQHTWWYHQQARLQFLCVCATGWAMHILRASECRSILTVQLCL
jgi:hypothetical protein